MHRISLAYGYVALFMMLHEANHCACDLQLPVPQMITERELVVKFVGTPSLIGEGGAIDTQQFSFGFSDRGILRYVTRLHPFGAEPLLPLHLHQSRLKSLVDKDQALQVARTWLTAMDVSVGDLEKVHQPIVAQEFFYPEATPTGSVSNLEKILLPIFDVAWTAADETRAAVKVSIYGPTKELLSLRQEDDSFSRRPEHLVRDIESLQAIPGAEFLKYSPAQLEELLIRHANTNFDIIPFLVSSSGEHTNILMQFPVQPRAPSARPGAQSTQKSGP